MTVEVVEGVLEAAEPSGGNRKYARYRDLKIIEPSGRPRSLGKLAAGGRSSRKSAAAGRGAGTSPYRAGRPR